MVCSSNFMEVISCISQRILIKFTFEFSSVSLSFLWVFSFVSFWFLFCLVWFGLCPYNCLMILGSLFISKSQTVESWLELLGAGVAYDHWQASYRWVRRWTGIFTGEPQISVTLVTLSPSGTLNSWPFLRLLWGKLACFSSALSLHFVLSVKWFTMLPSALSIHILW